MVAILNAAAITGLIASMIELSVPMAFAALGEVISERGGVINLGTEGVMLVGAISAFSVGFFMHNDLLGILLGAFAGALMGLLLAFVSVSLKQDQILTGLGIYFLGLGLSGFLYDVLFSNIGSTIRIEGLQKLPIPILSLIPILGDSLFSQDIIEYLAFVSLVIVILVIGRTTFGLNLRAVGENPSAADTLGVNVSKIKYIAVIAGAALAGIGGAYLAISSHAFQAENITAGRGFIAVAMVYFGKWKPARAFFGTFLFGAAYLLGSFFQVVGSMVPYYFLLMVPYIMTLIILVIIARGARQPSALGVPYTRESG
ncbi:MAG: ABC transporter permease [Candidatus Bathyarchaeia archaeon]|jgi:simple sugar transport system permease protein